MNRAERRAAYRAARTAPVERTLRKRAALSFITGLLVGLAMPIALLLAGCSAEVGVEQNSTGIEVGNDNGCRSSRFPTVTQP